MSLGLVCDVCDSLSPVSAAACERCGEPLALLSGRTVERPTKDVPKTAVSDDSSERVTTVHRVAEPVIVACGSCGTPMPATHRFCGSCGATIADNEALAAPVAKQTLVRAAAPVERGRLVVIRQGGTDGDSFPLVESERHVGRVQGEICFPGDVLLSPRHACFFFQGSALFVRDEGSRNGVFVRLRNPYDLGDGQPFLVGEQLLSVTLLPSDPPHPEADGTHYYTSPRRPARLRLVQFLAGGAPGFIFRARTETITIGREDNDINFPDDPFISGHHAQVTALLDGRFRLVDRGSKNGTFVRLRGETQLQAGDFIFLGQQLLRVELYAGVG